MFEDLYKLSLINDDTIRTYMEIMLHRDLSSNMVAVITPTMADARRLLIELEEHLYYGKANVNDRVFIGQNGVSIHFIPITHVKDELKGRGFKAIHFRK